MLERLGLRRMPFPPTPDAATYYTTANLESELAEALHCLQVRAGFVLLTGEIGTGKSTFVRRLLDQAGREGMVSSLVFNTFLQGGELLSAILCDFGLEPAGSLAADVETFNRFLLELWRNGHGCLLVIDDAQNLDLESLELLRLLSSIETGQEKLLQIVLAGQPELRTRLNQPRIRQLTSRIVKHVRLEPLQPQEILDYVHFRLQAAGAGPDIVFDAEAAAALSVASKGNPRRIHLVMDRCLYGLLALDTRRIDAALVRSAAAEAGALPARRRQRRSPPSLAVAASAGLVLLSALLGVANRQAPARTQPALPTVTGARPAQAPRVCAPWLSALSSGAAWPAPGWATLLPAMPACKGPATSGWTMLANASPTPAAHAPSATPPPPSPPRP